MGLSISIQSLTKGISGRVKFSIEVIRRYQITIGTGFALLAMGAFAFFILIHLGLVSMEKAKSIKRELVERDLRELIGHFEADEKFALEHNLTTLIPERREISPLLLPRQYYVGLPLGRAQISPRQPPRNCFVQLIPVRTAESSDLSVGDRVCLYFAESKLLGKYLFMVASYQDSGIDVLKPGDLSLSADALKMTATFQGKSATWWLTQQLPPAGVAKGRYELTAVRETPAHIFERDKRVEGWTYTQKQRDGSQVVNIIARLDVKEFFPQSPSENSESVWPPEGWGQIRFKFQRKDISDGISPPRVVQYSDVGTTAMSLSSLAESIYNTHGQISINSIQADGTIKEIPIPPPSKSKDVPSFSFGNFSLVDGDLVITADDPEHKLKVPKDLPDTSLSFTVSHPGKVIEKGVWQTLVQLALLFIVGIVVAIFFVRRILYPIILLTTRTYQMLSSTEASNINLPFASQKDEIGTLSKGFNELLRDTRERTLREQNAKEEQLRARENNLRVIGHEIRSPLQSLMSLNPPGTDSRNYIERISAALPHLEGSLAPENAFNSREMNLEEIDVASFVRTLCENAGLQKIHDVKFSGPESGIYCNVDDGALEDALSHILANADQFRQKESLIQVRVGTEGGDAEIFISNVGPYIPEENKEKIFEFGFTSKPSRGNAGTGVGLFVARSYITHMGGSVCASNFDCGAAFTIKLPIAIDALENVDLHQVQVPG